MMDFLVTCMKLLFKTIITGVSFFTIIGLWISTWSVIKDNSYTTYRTLKGEYIKNPNFSLGDKLLKFAITLVFTGILAAFAVGVWMF